MKKYKICSIARKCLQCGEKISLGGYIVNGSAQENVAYLVLRMSESCT